MKVAYICFISFSFPTSPLGLPQSPKEKLPMKPLAPRVGKKNLYLVKIHKIRPMDMGMYVENWKKIDVG